MDDDRMDRMSDWRPPSKLHLLNLAVAMIGFIALVIGFGAEVRIRVGANPLDAIGREGAVALLFFGVVIRAFTSLGMRPGRYQNLVHTLVRRILQAELALGAAAALCIVSQWNTKGQAAGAFVAIWFTAWGLLCQISAFYWLLRYRHRQRPV